MKIMAEIDVPDGNECDGCRRLYKDHFNGDRCSVFNDHLGNPLRIKESYKCAQCRAAAVKEDEDNIIECPSCGADWDIGTYAGCKCGASIVKE